MSWAVFASLAGVVIAPLLTYVVAARKQSGRVATTEAETLWLEAEKMRESYKQEAVRLREEVIALRAETVALRVETVTLRNETLALRQEAIQWREEGVLLREDNARLRAEAAIRGGRRRGDKSNESG